MLRPSATNTSGGNLQLHPIGCSHTVNRAPNQLNWVPNQPKSQKNNLAQVIRTPGTGSVLAQISCLLMLGLAWLDGPRPTFNHPTEFWNHYSIILVHPEYPRTNNMVEGFHRGFRSLRRNPLVLRDTFEQFGSSRL